MKRIGVLLSVAALMAPAAAQAGPTVTGWSTITKFHGVRGQMCLLESSADYPFHVLFRVNALNLESGWARAILSYKRPDDTDWRGYIISHRAYPGEVQEGLPGSTDDQPKALRVRVRLSDGRDKFQRYDYADLLPCPADAQG
jgi:hypothetical protein